jgi:hypothetical protein
MMDYMAVERNKKITLSLLYLYSFFAGMGIEMPIVNFIGNFGFGDILLIFAFFLQVYYKKNIKIHWLSIVLFVFGSISLLSYANALIIDSIDVSSLGYIFRFFFYALLVGLYITTTKTLDIFYNHLKYLVSGTFVFLITSWFYFFTEDGVFYSGIPTLGYLLSVNPNTQAFYYTLITPIIIFLFFIEKKNKIIALFLLFCFLFSSFATLSKTGWGAIILILLFMLYALILYKHKIMFFLLSMVITTSIFTNYDFLFTIINNRITSSSGSTGDRINLILNGLSIWSHYPVFGAGPRAFMYRISEYGSNSVIAHDTHHAWSNLLAEIGVIVVLLIAMTYLIALVIARNVQNYHRQFLSYKHRRLTSVFFITFIVLLLLWSNFTGLFYSDKIPWIILSLLFSYKRILPSSIIIYK